MEEFKGTPGKWGFSHGSASDSSTACIEITSTESLHEVAYLQSTPSHIGHYEPTSFDKTVANAHLIAAAPELLEALQKLRVYAEDVCGVCPDDCHEEHPLMMASYVIDKALGK